MSLVGTLLSAIQAVLTSLSLTHYLALFVGLLGFIYWYMQQDVGKFEAKGLKSEKPTFFFGNNKKLFMEEESLMDFHINWYKKFPNER